MPTTPNPQAETGHENVNGEYQDCYVAFLDVLGFQQLVERSVGNVQILQKLRKIVAHAANPRSGMKDTSYGPCPIQVRAFSDSFVVFTPAVKPGKGTVNSLAQLCFVVRYFHDRLLELDACIRGGIVQGKMYWHPSWSEPHAARLAGQENVPALTFGPGLNAAYDLESKKAIYPRVLVSHALAKKLQRDKIVAFPFAKLGATLHEVLRADAGDQMMHLDLLNACVVRQEGEEMHNTVDGFSVKWSDHATSTHADVLATAKRVADGGMTAENADGKVWQKYAWLASYCQACENNVN